MSQYGSSEEYDYGWEDGYDDGYRAGKEDGRKQIIKKKALRIVRVLIKAYEAGDANDTLAYRLQQEMKL